MADTSDGGAPIDEDPAIPASFRAAWGVRDRPARGPRPGLSLERIVAAGIAVAGADGLEAVSMGRVATELGSSPMSLYRYVSAKHELLSLMVDTALGDPPAAANDAPGWRAGLERWSGALLDAYLAAPWTVRAPIPAPPITPHQIRWMEAGLTCLRGTGLTAQEKLSTILLLSGIARFHAGVAADFADAQRVMGGADPTAGYGRAVAVLADPGQFPEVHAAAASGSMDDDGDQEDYAPAELRFGLDRVLDGLDVLIRRRGAADRPAGAADPLA
jgi:AcrR family transcriptional regulator